MKRSHVLAALAVLALVISPLVTSAQECNIGTGLGSSVLIPYFELDPASPAGLTTLFSVVSESSQDTMVRVVLWTDWGMPTLAFDVFLPRFDLQSFNVRDLFNGVIPSTGSGEDLSAFNFCNTPQFTPVHSNPALSVQERAQLVAWHSGVEGPLVAGCGGENHGDGRVRGYITMDTVDECSGVQIELDDGQEEFFPTFGGYFADGGGGAGAIAVAQNRIWGDYILVDPANAFAQGSKAITLWADPARFTDDPTFTFYGRFNGYDGRDERVPLPTWWATRFLDGGAFSGGTDLFIWRDTGEADPGPVACAGHPPWWPLQEGFITARDETASDASRVFIGTESNFFPLATQRVPVSDFSLPYDFGRIQLSLADGPGLDNPRQGWLQTVLSANNLFSAGFNAQALNDICDTAP
ncbi:MAG TPA: hypothetical protein VKU40_03930 [Thermoanaerobaculia bacterium]|nr:hypothetical protein [Thermoanaerobaculia bacterium]